MTTSNTPRIGLSKPDENELMTQLDRDWNGPMDKIDAAAGVFSCTSGSRPASPYTGQTIYETDTGKTLIWHGSGWIVYNAKDSGWRFSSNPAQSVTSGTITDIQWNTRSSYNGTQVGSTQFQVTQPGLYLVSLFVKWSAKNQNAMNFYRAVNVTLLNAANAILSRIERSDQVNATIATNDVYNMMVGGFIATSTVGDKFTARVVQQSGAAWSLVASECIFRGALVAPIESF